MKQDCKTGRPDPREGMSPKDRAIYDRTMAALKGGKKGRKLCSESLPYPFANGHISRQKSAVRIHY